MKLSVVVLTKNEEKMIEECLNLLQFADEIIVVDDNSVDKTVEIAKKFTPHVFIHQKINFSNQREFALKQAHGEWILYIDADERVQEFLKNEVIKTVSEETKYSGFFLRRDNYYLGEKWPYQEKVQRLFKKEKLNGWYGELHETPNIEGELGVLEHPLQHYSHRNLSEMMQKTIEWSKVEAKLRLEAKHPKVVSWRFCRIMITEFFHYYIGQKGYKARTMGLIESLYQSFSIFITYVRLYEMQQKQFNNLTI